MSEEKPYNSKIIDTYIKLINSKKEYKDKVYIHHLLSYSGMKPEEVSDPSIWFSQEQVDRFHEKLTEMLGKDIAHEAGRYAASPEASGIMRRIFLGVLTPSKAYEIIGNHAHEFTKSTKFETKRIDPNTNTVEIIVIPNIGVSEKAYQCRNRIGYFEAISLLFGRESPEIKHEDDDCFFKKNKEHCRYIVSWKQTTSDVWRKYTKYVPEILFLMCCFISIVKPSILLFIIPFSFVVHFFLKSHILKLENDEIHKVVDEELRNSSDELLKQIHLSYDTASLIKDIAKKIDLLHADEIDPLEFIEKANQLLEEIIQSIQDRLGYKRGALFLSDRSQRLLYRAGFGYTPDEITILKSESANDLLSRSFKEKQPELVNDIDQLKANIPEKVFELLTQLKTRAYISCPVMYENKPLGVLEVNNPKNQRPLIQTDVNLLMGIMPHIGFVIHNFLRKVDEILEHIRLKEKFAEQKIISPIPKNIKFLTAGRDAAMTLLEVLKLHFSPDPQLSKRIEDVIQAILKEQKMVVEREIKESVIRSAVHNIVNPANNVQTAILAMKKHLKNDGKMLDRLERMDKNIFRIKELAEDFKRYLLPASSKLESVNIEYLIENCVQRFEGNGQKIKIEKSCEVIPYIQADPKGLKRVIEEIINNAFKHAARQVVIKIYCNDGKLIIICEDDGCGVDEKVKENMFELLVSGDSLGTGMGLAIAADIILENKGKIYYDDSYKNGAKFVIELPIGHEEG